MKNHLKHKEVVVQAGFSKKKKIDLTVFKTLFAQATRIVRFFKEEKQHKHNLFTGSQPCFILLRLAEKALDLWNTKLLLLSELFMP